MRIFPENFDDYGGCFEGLFDAPKVDGQTLIIPAIRLPLFKGHPLEADSIAEWYPGIGWVVKGLFVFKGVVLSRRELNEYIGDPKNPAGFKAPCIVEDINTHSTGVKLNRYEFEGSLDNPPAFIGFWLVIARSFELHVE